MQRGFLSSLPRGQKRSSPTTITTTQLPSVNSRALSLNSYSRTQLVACQRSCSKISIPAHRNLRRHYLPKEITNYSNPSTRSFSSFVDKLKQQAEEAAKSVAKEASKRARETAEQASKKAQKVVSDTIESTQTVAKNATDQAIRSVSKKASEAAEGVTKATKETLKSTVDGAKQQVSKTVSESTTVQSISRSTRAISSGIEQTTKVASQSAETIKQGAETIKKSSVELIEKSKELKENITSTSTKVIRWFWWWSLAAIFVYGVASTLPMAIIKYSVEQKKEAFQERMKSFASEDSEKKEEEAATDAQPES